MRRVLFVSKPVEPPWNDGSKNLVRDLAEHFARTQATVLNSDGGTSLATKVRSEPVYQNAGGFSPALSANVRVLRRLLSGDPHDAWHVVAAPHRVSTLTLQGAVASWRLRGWKGKVVQTVASMPQDVEQAPSLLFGDRVVVLTEWSRARLLGLGVSGERLRVIPPCARPLRAVTEEERRGFRRTHGLGEGPVVLYPGDYEVSRGAKTFAEAIASILHAAPSTRFVFACRTKTPKAEDIAARLRADFRANGLSDKVLLLGNVADMAVVLSASDLVVFPVEDLSAKVDVPLVLLEASAMGKPLVLASGGPLEALTAARFVVPCDAEALGNTVIRLLREEGTMQVVGNALRRQYEERFSPGKVAPAYEALYDDVLGA